MKELPSTHPILVQGVVRQTKVALLRFDVPPDVVPDAVLFAALQKFQEEGYVYLGEERAITNVAGHPVRFWEEGGEIRVEVNVYNTPRGRALKALLAAGVVIWVPTGHLRRYEDGKDDVLHVDGLVAVLADKASA